MQKFIAIGSFEFAWEQNEISITFHSQWKKKCEWNGHLKRQCYIHHRIYQVYPKKYVQGFPCALLCLLSFGTRWFFYPYPSGLLHKHWRNLMIAAVVMKHPWRIWVNTMIGVKYGFDSVQAAYLNRTEVGEYLLHLYVIEDGENDSLYSYINKDGVFVLGGRMYLTPNPAKHITTLLRYQSWYGLIQWEEALLCNASSHWQSPYPVWSLHTNPLGIHNMTTTKQSTTKPCGYSVGYTFRIWWLCRSTLVE